MKRNKLFYLLSSLDPKEMRQFKKQVIREGSIPMIKLVDYLEQQLKSYDEQSYETLREKALQKISKSVPTDQNKRRLLANTTKLLSTFLIKKELSLNELTGESLLQKQYLRRGLNKLYESSLDQAKKTFKQNSVQDFYNQQAQLQINHNIYYHATNKYKEKDILNGLRAIHEKLDMGFVMAKLHYACEVKAVQLVRGEAFNIEFLDEVLSKINEINYLEHPIIKLYNNILHLIDQPNLDDYQELKNQWLEVAPMLSSEIQHQLFIIILNLSWFSCTENRTKEMFELYQFGLTSGILIPQNKIAATHFNNIVDLGSSLGRFSEIREFIEQFVPFLNIREDKLDNIKTLYEAFLLFGEGKHDQALHLSIFLEFNDVSYGLRAYLLIVKCIYESKKSKGFKEIESRCEAFKQYVQRKFKTGMINSQTKQENLNFIKIIRQLPLASASRFAGVSKEELERKTNAMQHVVSKKWLQKKIAALT